MGDVGGDLQQHHRHEEQAVVGGVGDEQQARDGRGDARRHEGPPPSPAQTRPIADGAGQRLDDDGDDEPHHHDGADGGALDLVADQLRHAGRQELDVHAAPEEGQAEPEEADADEEERGAACDLRAAAHGATAGPGEGAESSPKRYTKRLRPEPSAHITARLDESGSAVT